MNETVKASKLETLGAWLGLWTPPRDVVVPPIPWRKVALAAAGLAVLIAATAVFVAPAVDDAKQEGAAERQRERDQIAAALRERIIRMQQPRLGEPAALATVEAAIGADARERFSPDARTATCEMLAGADPNADRVPYDCLTATSDIRGAADQEGAQGQLGYPYRAILDRTKDSYAFCRINPLPGEQALADPDDAIRLPAACRP